MVVGSHLTDTNILLRVSQRNDPDYDLILSAVRSLRAVGAILCYTSQNLAEFWNVCTRPARQNGYGLTVAETNRRAELIERGFTLLPDDPRVHTEWRRLVVAHAVMGVQVHDARLVAAMHVHGIERLLTLDQRDFMRYPGITVVHPRELVKS